MEVKLFGLYTAVLTKNEYNKWRNFSFTVPEFKTYVEKVTLCDLMKGRYIHNNANDCIIDWQDVANLEWEIILLQDKLTTIAELWYATLLNNDKDQ